MIVLYKAELIVDDNSKSIRSVGSSYSFPSVIKLFSYKKNYSRNIKFTRKNIFRRDDNKCQYCGGNNSNLTLDHVIPRSRGGNSSWENLVTSCFVCNNKKGDKTPIEAQMPLLKKPSKPTNRHFLYSSNGNIQSQWQPFIYH